MKLICTSQTNLFSLRSNIKINASRLFHTKTTHIMVVRYALVADSCWPNHIRFKTRYTLVFIQALFTVTANILTTLTCCGCCPWVEKNIKAIRTSCALKCENWCYKTVNAMGSLITESAYTVYHSGWWDTS